MSTGISGTPEPRRTNGHPTYERLVESATALLQEHSLSEVTTDMVLKHSAVSRGSLYHHFEDLSDLIETALVRSFSTVVDENIALLRNLLSSAQDIGEYHRAIIDFNDFAQGSQRQKFRLNRVRMLGNAIGNPRMSKKLAIEQERKTAAYAELFNFAQSRGWMSKEIDSRAAAVFIQAFTIGRVIDDICEETMDLEACKSLLLHVFRNVFLLNQPNVITEPNSIPPSAP